MAVRPTVPFPAPSPKLKTGLDCGRQLDRAAVLLDEAAALVDEVWLAQCNGGRPTIVRLALSDVSSTIRRAAKRTRAIPH